MIAVVRANMDHYRAAAVLAVGKAGEENAPEDEWLAAAVNCYEYQLSLRSLLMALELR